MPLLAIITFWILDLLILLLIVSSVLSWFAPNPRNPVVRLIRSITDPLLHPFRAILPATGSMDFSPLLATLVLYILRSLLEQRFLS